MKYPAHTKSNPLSAKEAKVVIRAVETGKALSSPESRATVQEIIEKYGKTSLSPNGKDSAKVQK